MQIILHLLTNYLFNLLTNPPIFDFMFRYAIIIFFLVFIASCRPAVYPPKPSGYFRIDTPAAHLYQVFDKPGFPYTFEYPVYGIVSSDTVFRDQKGGNAYWININFPGLGGVINITYKEFNSTGRFDSLINDSYGLSFAHHEKADYIKEDIIHTPYASGVLYTVGGNAASHYQFTLTDSVKHFIRGALYFDVTPNADSLKPANDFLERDIEHMFWTLRWR